MDIISSGVVGSLWYLAPGIPLLSRGILLIRHHGLAFEQLSEEELDRDAHLGVLLTLTGFSFSAVVALVLLEPSVEVDLGVPVYLVFLSFIALLLASNLQGYKSSRWQDQLATAFSEAGMLSLILALAALLVGGEFSLFLELFLPCLGVGVWAIDHAVRLRFQWIFLDEVEKEKKDE